MGKQHSEPLKTQTERSTYYKRKRRDLVARLGRVSYIGGVEFLLLSVTPDGETDLYATSVLQERLPQWFPDRVRQEAIDLCLRARERDQVLEAQDEAIATSNQAFAADGTAVSLAVTSTAPSDDSSSFSEEERDTSKPSTAAGSTRASPDKAPVKAVSRSRPTRKESTYTTGSTHKTRVAGPGSPASHVLKPVTFTPAALDDWYKACFSSLNDRVSKLVLREWIKAVAPRKVKTHPYASGEASRPPWWPEQVRHKDPDHLFKQERIILFQLILRRLAESIDQLAAATGNQAALIPHQQNMTLREVYKVAKEERKIRSTLPEHEPFKYLTVTLLDKNVQEADVVPIIPNEAFGSAGPSRQLSISTALRPRDAGRPYSLARSRSAGPSEDGLASPILSRSRSQRGLEASTGPRARTVYTSPDTRSRPLSASTLEGLVPAYTWRQPGDDLHASRSPAREPAVASPSMIRSNSRPVPMTSIEEGIAPTQHDPYAARSPQMTWHSPPLPPQPTIRFSTLQSGAAPQHTFQFPPPSSEAMSDPLPSQKAFAPLFPGTSADLYPRTMSSGSVVPHSWDNAGFALSPLSYSTAFPGSDRPTTPASPNSEYLGSNKQPRVPSGTDIVAERTAEEAAAMASAADFANPLTTPLLPPNDAVDPFASLPAPAPPSFDQEHHSSMADDDWMRVSQHHHQQLHPMYHDGQLTHEANPAMFERHQTDLYNELHEARHQQRHYEPQQPVYGYAQPYPMQVSNDERGHRHHHGLY